MSNSDEIAKVRSWSFNFNQSVLETVSLGDTDRTIIPWYVEVIQVTCSIYYYQIHTSGSGSGKLTRLNTRI